MYKLLIFSVLFSGFICAAHAQDDEKLEKDQVRQAKYSESSFFDERVHLRPKSFSKAPRRIKNKKNMKRRTRLVKRNKSWLAGEKHTDNEEGIVTIPATIFDKAGNVVENIRAAEFKVFEDGIERIIKRVGRLSAPKTIIALVDLSNSNRHSERKYKAGLNRFVDMLTGSDRLTIIGFDKDVYVLVEPTNDKDKLKTAIDKIRFVSATAIYDAVRKICFELIPWIGGQKTMVVFSDGIDTSSTRTSSFGSIAYARRSNITVLSIYYDSQSDRLKNKKTRNRFGIRFSTRKLKSVTNFGMRYLQALSYSTGGQIINAGVSEEDLEKAFVAAYRSIRSQRYIEYRSDLNSRS